MDKLAEGQTIDDCQGTKAPVEPSAAIVALAAKFQCHGLQPPPDRMGTGMTPLAIYDCALPQGLNASIVAYTSAQMPKLREPATLRPACRAVERYPEVGALYAVYGEDFVASVQVGGDNLPNGPATFEARSKTLARALRMNLTTVPCD